MRNKYYIVFGIDGKTEKQYIHLILILEKNKS